MFLIKIKRETKLLMKKINILECTLRDGSYAIDYQFTAEDTAIIAAGLENAGFRFIEIGHGLGLNASNAGEGVAAASDEDYLKAAASVLKNAKFGMFFIPGIGRAEDLKMAADYGMEFVRIGTNAPEAAKAEKYIKQAKRLGMTVSSNLMKSYALSPKELAEKARFVENWGADIVYIVDSAGGMLPTEIKEYIEAVKAKTNSIEIGLHPHNNLSLAVANTLAAIEAGATMVDSCLQGMGRSGGNAQTEILVLALEKLGYNLGIDPIKVMDLGKKVINPLLHRTGVDPIDVTSGYAMFHSKFLKNVYKASNKYGLDPRELIIASSKRSVVNVPEELVMSIAEELKEKGQKKKG
jgi:4-hydroxy-2-oxovalerate aldolase